MTLKRYATKVLEELGLISLYKSPLDTKLLCLQRFVRLFAYGGSTLILVSYLSALGISYSRSGLFMALTLVGDVLISFCLTLIADGLGRKTILALGAALMAGSGVVFGLSGNYWILLAAAIFGVISPSGNEIGPFRAIEESTLAHLSLPEVRSDIYAWYALIGTGGTAFGMLTCGWIVRHLKTLDGWDDIRAYRVMFFGYAVCGLIKLALALALSRNVEVDKPEAAAQPDPETAPLLSENGVDEDPALKKPKKRSLMSILPSISPESRIIVVNLCLLFALDAFASGLVSLTWVTRFFKTKFDLEEGVLGTLFFVTSIIAAGSMLAASSISKRIGNIKTMVFTHLPSAIALALIPIPDNVHFAMLFLILRSCTQSMDVAPRSAFLAAVILPNERTAVMAMVNLVKTASSSLGPLITGLLADRGLFWISFVVAGSLKATYDLGVLAVFAGHVSREDKAKAAAQAEAEANGAGEVQNGNSEESSERAARDL